jgi:hypothetical protein
MITPTRFSSSFFIAETLEALEKLNETLTPAQAEAQTYTVHHRRVIPAS